MRQFAYADTQLSAGSFTLTAQFPNPTLAGSAIFAWSRSSIDANPDVIARFSDDKGNVYTSTNDTQSDPAGQVNASSATAYAVNVASGTQAVTGTYIPFGDFRSIVIAEIAGVSAQPFLANASSIVTTAGAGTDNISSGSFTVSVVPAIVIAISSNESQVHGPPFPPAAGTGLSSLGTVTNYGMGNDFGRLAYAVITTTGTRQASFSALGADEYLTFAVVFH